MLSSMPDLVDVCTGILSEAMSAHPLTRSGQPIVGPRYAVRCSDCGERIESRPQITGPSSTAYVLPIDSEGRCAACALTLCLTCDGKPGGCAQCDWTGREA